VIHPDTQARGHKNGEIKEQQARGLTLDRQGADQGVYEQTPQQKSSDQMSAKHRKELPDRKRIDQGSDLASVKSQHHQHERIVKQDPSHFRLLARGGMAGQSACGWNSIQR
jgi:hypothetical protein